MFVCETSDEEKGKVKKSGNRSFTITRKYKNTQGVWGNATNTGRLESQSDETTCQLIH